MASHSTRVGQDIARWLEAGLIDVATADALRRDIEVNRRGSLSFGAILAMMAALLFGAAILIFVAANWEAFPRLGRVGLLFSLILAGYLGGAVCKLRGHAAIGEALWVVAAAAFGGSIALVGQMYHLAGDESSALLVWCAGTALAACILRSSALTVAAVAIADAWLVMTVFGNFDIFRDFQFPHLFVVALVTLFAMTFWTRSRVARHLIALSLILYVALLAIDHDTMWLAIALAAVCAGVFGVAVVAPRPVEAIVRLGGRLPLHALIGFLTGMAIIQFELMNGHGFVVASAVALAGIAAALVFAGRESRALRWVAYLGFAFQLCVIYAVTMETMLGTAGFFLAAAITLAVVAFVIFRVERRMKEPANEGAAS